jgi:anionic cell wall polymer biosynthesis LytR-Cps2A-Psr (LCP) family protein
MDGATAVAYARTRQGIGDNDFTRADRQQQILAAVRDKLTAGNLILALPGLLDAVKNTISTDLPESRIPELAAALQEADTDALERAVIQPPLVTPATASDGAYILIPDIDGIRELAADLLGDGDTTASRH